MTTLTSIGDAVIVTDTRGIVTLVNSVAGRLTGWGEDAVGKPLKDVFRIVNESTRRAVENPVDKVLREGTIVGLANHTVLIAKDGVDLPIDDSGAPVRNKEGELTGVVLVFRDITERRAAEAALARSARQFHLIAETIPQMVWMAAPGGRIEYLNQRWLKYTGLSPEETKVGNGNASSTPTICLVPSQNGRMRSKPANRLRSSIGCGARTGLIYGISDRRCPCAKTADSSSGSEPAPILMNRSARSMRCTKVMRG
jgi:PAS domain S-box-containing protein